MEEKDKGKSRSVPQEGDTMNQSQIKKKMRYVTSFGEKNYLTEYDQKDSQILIRVKLNKYVEGKK